LLDCSQATYSTQCTQLASRLSNITTVTTGQITVCSDNAVWPPEDMIYDMWSRLLDSVKQPTPHSTHSLPADSPTSQQLQQDRKPYAVKTQSDLTIGVKTPKTCW